MPYINNVGVKIYYETIGSGEPIVFVAGFSGDHTAWTNLIEEFAKYYQVIVFDNRGIGKSDCPNYSYTTEMMADDVAALIKALRLKSAHLVGHSFGGCIVQTVAHKYPKLTKSVVIASSVLKANMRAVLYIQIRSELEKAKAPSESIIKFISLLCWSNNYLSKPGMIQQLVDNGFYPMTKKGYRNQANAMLTFDSRTWIGEIKVPCLIIGADEDLLADLEDSQEMHKTIKNSEFYCFKKVGHVPSVEQPKIFNQLVLKFLSKQTPKYDRLNL